MNSSAENASIDLRLVNQAGQEVASTSLDPATGGQMARFVDELFDSVQGVLELTTAADGIVSVGLLQTGLVTTSLPTHHYGTWSRTQ